MTCGIYSVMHRESGKVYVGRSTNIEQRWCEHRSDVRRGRLTCAIHHALKKYGFDAFDWAVVLCAEARFLSGLEAAVILDVGSMSPRGYNVGGTVGGFPTKADIEAMVPGEAARRTAMYRQASSMGIEAVRVARLDPSYEAAYLLKMSAAGKSREANIRARRATDPKYDERMREVRTRASKLGSAKADRTKAAATFQERMRNPEYAARIRANRARAASSRWKKGGGTDANLS